MFIQSNAARYSGHLWTREGRCPTLSMLSRGKTPEQGSNCGNWEGEPRAAATGRGQLRTAKNLAHDCEPWGGVYGGRIEDGGAAVALENRLYHTSHKAGV